jgi:hypothetical protein
LFSFKVIQRRGHHFILLKSTQMQPDSEVQCDEKKLITRRKFTCDEDEQIYHLVEQFGVENWDQIARELGTNRTKRQLRERWQNYLDPTLDLGYSEQEDERLVQLFKECGPQWAKIAALIGKKSAISARNRYRCLMSLRAKGQRPRYVAALPQVEVVMWPDFDMPAGDQEMDLFSFDFLM